MSLRGIFDKNGNRINPATYEAQLPGEYPASVHLTRWLSTTTLAAPSSKGDRVITVADPAGYAIGSQIMLKDEFNTENDVLKVIGISGSDLSLDRTLDVDHLAGSQIDRVSVDMNVLGSVVSPVVYEFKPSSGVWRICNIHLMMASSSEPSLDKFGGISALENGLHIKQVNDLGRDYTFSVPFRSNKSIDLIGAEYQKEPKVLTQYWTHFGVDFERLFCGMYVLSSTSSLQAIVQDDLTGLSSFEIKIGLRRID